MKFEKTSDLNLVCRWLNTRLWAHELKAVIEQTDDWQQKWHPHANLKMSLVDDMPFGLDYKMCVRVFATDGDETLEHAMHRLCNRFWSEFETKFDDYTQMVSSNDDYTRQVFLEMQLGSWKHVFEHISSREELELKLSVEG